MLTFAPVLALAPAGASLAQVSIGAGTATDGSGSGPNGASTAPGAGIGGPAGANPDSPQSARGQANSKPSPVTRNHNDCNKTNCVDNPSGRLSRGARPWPALVSAPDKTGCAREEFEASRDLSSRSSEQLRCLTPAPSIMFS